MQGVVSPQKSTEQSGTDFEAWNAIQEHARTRIWDGFRDVKCLAAVAPTGFGKTRLGSMLIKDVQRKGYPWVWYTHRKTLTTQTMRSFQDQGLDFGVRASGLPDFEDVTKPGQIAMLQSERAAIKSGKRQLHDARFVIVDESHANATGYADEVIGHHLQQGANVLLMTATPVSLSRAEKLTTLASVSEMRNIGALLPARCYSPSEVSMKDVRKIASGEFSPSAQAKKFMNQQVVGDIFRHYRKLNPNEVPTIGFAPDVKSSMWLCDYFNDHGVKSAHIDGEDVYLGEHDIDGNPVVYKSSQEMRDRVFDALRTGEIKVVFNRFLFREGVDIPELGHAIFACAFGSPATWIQACGRVLRAHSLLSHVTIQDHGGNCRRPGLGSPNADRDWSLSDTNKSIVDLARKQRSKTGEDTSVRCPYCHLEIARGKWIAAGNQCPICHRKFRQASRIIFQTDGELKLVKESKPQKGPSDPQKLWTKTLYQFGSSEKRYSQAAAYFRSQTGKYPDEAQVTPICRKGQRQMLVEDIWHHFNRKSK